MHNGTSKEYYGRQTEPVREIEQDIKLLGDMYKDKSYLIIKQLENNNLSAIIQSLISKNIMQELCVRFADDANFFIKKNNSEEKIQQILDIYSRLYKETGKNIVYKKQNVLVRLGDGMKRENKFKINQSTSLSIIQK